MRQREFETICKRLAEVCELLAEINKVEPKKPRESSYDFTLRKNRHKTTQRQFLRYANDFENLSKIKIRRKK